MAHVTVTIAGRAYRMACGEGEEAHLEGLAALVDTKIGEIRSAFGEIGDQRITVMTALTFADELAETKRRIARLESEVAAVRASGQDDAAARARMAGQMSEALEDAASRIEQVAQALNGPSRG